MWLIGVRARARVDVVRERLCTHRGGSVGVARCSCEAAGQILRFAYNMRKFIYAERRTAGANNAERKLRVLRSSAKAELDASDVGRLPSAVELTLG